MEIEKNLQKSAVRRFPVPQLRIVSLITPLLAAQLLRAQDAAVLTPDHAIAIAVEPCDCAQY